MKSLRHFLALLLLLVSIYPGGASAGKALRTSNVAVTTRIEAEEKNALDVFLTTIRNARHHLAAAAVARSVSIFSMYPVDTIKV